MNVNLNDIVTPYFLGDFGTFNLYQNSPKDLPDRNCTQISVEMQRELQNAGYKAHLCVMFCGSKINHGVEEGINPNHVMVICDENGKRMLFDPTLFLDRAIELPSELGETLSYEVPLIRGGIRNDTRYAYTKIAPHKYKWQKFVGGGLLRQDYFTDRPVSRLQLKKIKGMQTKMRTDLKLGKVLLNEEGYRYAKLKFDPETNTRALYDAGTKRIASNINEFADDVYQLFGLTPEHINRLETSSRTFTDNINDMAECEEKLSLIEVNESLRGLDTKYNYIESSDTMYVYMHGLFGDIESSKGKQVAMRANEIGQSSARFSFRGNGESVSNEFGFENMNLETMSEDIRILIDTMITKGVKSFTPVASSLGASSLLYFLKKYPEYMKYMNKIILLAPSVEFARNRKRLRSEKGDDVTETKRRQQGYLKNYHYANQSTEKLSYSLFEQSFDASLSDFIKEIDIPVTIVAGRKDDIISFDDIEEIASNQKNITLLSVHDGHRLKESTKIIISSLTI